MTLAANNGNLANNQPKWGMRTVQAGSGKTAQAANLTALYCNSTPNSFLNTQDDGIFAVTAAKMANTTGEGAKTRNAAPGWNLRRQGQGPVIAAANVVQGVGFANGESAKLSGGTVNATAVLTSNATGNLASAVISVGGIFKNTSQITVAFNREFHCANVIVTGGTGYSNTDFIRVSNGTVNAIANIATNGSGVFTNAGITFTNIGLFANTKANADLVVIALAANGANSLGTGATITATLANSTGGIINLQNISLGGRAGRVHYECLVESSSLFSNNTAYAGNTVLPQ